MNPAAALWRQLRFERRQFWRNPSAAFFNFLLPLILLFLVASVYAGDLDELELLIPGIAGMSIMATTFSALAFNVTFLRERGILKRVRGTPMPTGAYLGGLLGSAVVNAAVQVALVVLIGRLVYGVPWPRDPLALCAFTALGVGAFAALGVAFSHAIPNFDSAAAYVNVVFLPLILISGVFFPAESLPPALVSLAEVLPLKHVVDGLHGAFVDGPGAGASLPGLVIVAAWGVAGALVATRWFRWE